jgi:hypothetical protein
MTIHLVASANHAYADRIVGWLDHATTYGTGVRITLAAVQDGDGAWMGPLRADYPAAHIVAYIRDELAYQPPLDHLQAGGFLGWGDFADSDTIIFTDGDALLQRPFTPDELGWLEDWPEGVIGASYNAGPDDTLGAEATRLGTAHLPVEEKEQARAELLRALEARGFDLSMPVYNLGVIVAKVSTYKEWYRRYLESLPRFADLFTHHAHQQWGLCAAAPGVSVLPYTFHLHGHYPAPDGAARSRGRITYRGDVVAFRHHL